VNRSDEAFPLYQTTRADFSERAELEEVKRQNSELRRKLQEKEIARLNALQYVLLMQFYQQSAEGAKEAEG